MSDPSIQAVAVSKQVSDLIFGPVSSRQFAIRYWNSGVVETGGVAPALFTLVLQHAGAYRRMLLVPSQLRIAEAYVYGDFDIEGDLELASHVANKIREHIRTAGDLLRLQRLLLTLPTSRARRAQARRALGAARVKPKHTPERDAAAVRAHYDVGNGFYKLFLDARMVYSCAYFQTGHETLEQAQTAKLDYICRKLRLKQGERLLDIGCGWGGLIMFAAKHYGVEALGITVSLAQAELARERIEAAGLGMRCRVEVRDYRHLRGVEPFDKLVSVGMAEHVGLVRLRAYFGHAFRYLKPGGLFLNHCITKDWIPPRTVASFLRWRDGDFTKKYVFPDGELVPIDALINAGRVAGFETRDVESLREHYARTLREWVKRLECAKEQAIAEVGGEMYRIWRLHMAGGAGGFENGRLNLHQTLLSKLDAKGRAPEIPLTRLDMYEPPGIRGGGGIP